MSAAAADLDQDDESPYWELADQVAALRGLGERDLQLVSEILRAVGAHAAASRGRRR